MRLGNEPLVSVGIACRYVNVSFLKAYTSYQRVHAVNVSCQDVASTAEVDMDDCRASFDETAEERAEATGSSMDVEGDVGVAAPAGDASVDKEAVVDDDMEEVEEEESKKHSEKREDEVESSTKHLSFLFEALEEPALIDVLGRTPALAQAVSRLLPFLTYGRRTAARLLAEKFTQVSFVMELTCVVRVEIKNTRDKLL